jgi:putative spermidine/putrescine transport system permease protein
MTGAARSDGRWFALPALLVLGLFFAAFVVFATVSLLHNVPGTASIAGPASLDNYRDVVALPLNRDVTLDTLWLAFELTAICILIGYPLAYVMARTPSRAARNLILFALIVTFLSGGVTRAYAWLIILGNNGLVNALVKQIGLAPLRLVHNRTGVIISLVHFLLPFFVLTLFGGLKTVPAALEEAARNLGASRLRSFVAVTLPLSVPALIAAATLTYAVALSSFLFPALLGGGRVQMAANLIYDKILTAFDIPAAAAMAALFLVIALACVGLLGQLERAVQRRFPAAGRRT